MMTFAAYVHSISPILQVCLSKERIGTKLQGLTNLIERNPKAEAKRTNDARKRGIQAQNVVLQDIFCVPRNCPGKRVRKERATG